MSTYTAANATMSFEVKGEYTEIGSLIQFAAPIRVWPYGKRWFLPYLTGKAEWHEMTAAPGGETTVCGDILDGQLVQDTHLHACVLRWFWIRVWLPTRRRLRKRRELQP